MSPLRSSAVPGGAVALVSAVVLAAPAGAGAAPWSAPAGFGGAGLAPGIPTQIAVDDRGRGAVVSTSKDGRLLIRTLDRRGRLGTPRALGRVAEGGRTATAMGSHGDLLVVWTAFEGRGRRGAGVLMAAARRGVHGRLRVHRIGRLQGELNPGSTDSIAAAADPRGGWAVAVAATRVSAATLSRSGRRTGALQRLGRGAEVDLGVTAGGQAVLAAASGVGLNSLGPFNTGVRVWRRAHGATFGEPAAFGGRNSGDPEVGVGDAGRWAVSWTDTASGDEEGVAFVGRPLVVRGDDGPTTPPVALPAAPQNRAFGTAPAVSGDGTTVVAWAQKASYDVFGTGEVRASAVSAAGVAATPQVLSDGTALVPQVGALAGGRTLVVWDEGGRLDAAVAGPDGRFGPSAAPKGPTAPVRVRSFGSPRSMATAGRYAAVTWTTGRRVRVSLRRF